MQLPLDEMEQFLRSYYKEELLEFVQGYPKDNITFTIDWSSLYQFNPDIADDAQIQPEYFIRGFEHVLQTIDLPVDIAVENARVGFCNVTPDVRVNELRKDHIGHYIGVYGRVSEMTQVNPEVQEPIAICQTCAAEIEMLDVGDEIELPRECPSCGEFTEYEFSHDKSESRDKQLIELSTLAEETGASQSDTLMVEVYDDLVGQVEAGDTLRLNGILKFDVNELVGGNKIDRSPGILLDCRGIDSEEQTFDDFEAERLDEIKAIAERKDLFEALTDSYAPHILTDEYGNVQKLGLVLQQFGGVRRKLPNGKERKRDINILLVGDPGAGKSQYLGEADAIAPKSVMASGKGATPAGLTATAEQSDLTNSWTLSAGALVLANNGLACIDEFDKMNDNTRKSMHEALEDQQVPINKAGINTTLSTKCSVLAAANPEHGRYARFEPLSEQIDLGPTMIQRFDLIFAMVDTQDTDRDKRIVKHQLAFDDVQEPEIEMDLLREYIAYARQRIQPSWTDADNLRDMIAEYYADLRERSTGDDGYSDIGPRVTDSLRRLSEASARARLSDTVEVQDVKRACDLMDYHIGQVALDENGEITQAGGDKSILEKKAEEQGEREKRHETICAYLEGNTFTPSDIARDLGMPREQVKDDLKRLVERERVDKLPNERYEA